jgi:hypothetical protein
MADDTAPVTTKTLERLLAAFNAHDLDAVMSFFADGWRAASPACPTSTPGDDRHWVAGDRGCSEWLLTGTSPSGETVEVRGCDLFEFRDGEVVRKDSYWKIVER